MSSAVSIQVNTAAGLQTTSVTLAASATTVVSEQPITLTATVAPVSATGTITFLDGNAAIGSASLTSGKGPLTLSTLSVGNHSLSAAYSGDAANAASTSNVVAVTITAAGTAPGSPSPSPSPDYGLTLSRGTLTVAQSTPGSLTVKVAPENGFNAALSFACSGLPSGWGCSFAPATLSGSTPQSTTMTVSATSSARWIPAPAGLVVALVSPLPLFWFGLGGKSRKAARWVLLFVFVLALAGCGTSGNTSQPPQQEQSSTYSVTVTASGASAPTHTQTFVLTMTQK
jgi:predicted small lipoprotein YifL